ncbi:MAG: hypothetical protein WKG52_10435 [Variovorax sp.]
MAASSILGGDHAPSHPPGTDVDALGPSDTSDSGSDVQTDGNRLAIGEASEGAFPIAHGSDSDAAGTGERASADPAAPDEDRDILPDRIGMDPTDALDAAVSVDDPTAASVDELAATEDDGTDEDGEGDDESRGRA